MHILTKIISFIASVLWLIGLSLPTGLFNAPKIVNFPGDSMIFLAIYIASFVYMVIAIASYASKKNAPANTTPEQMSSKDTARLRAVRGNAFGFMVICVLLVLILGRINDGKPESEWGVSVGILFVAAAAAFVAFIVVLVVSMLLIGKKK